MNYKEICMWYAIIGLLTCTIGIFRNIKGKQSIEPTELEVLSWFFFWPLYIGFLLFKNILKLKKKLF